MRKNKFLHLWKGPLLLAFITIFGLLAALFGTGIWHFLSWLAMSVPLVTLLYFTWQDKKKVS